MLQLPLKHVIAQASIPPTPSSGAELPRGLTAAASCPVLAETEDFLAVDKPPGLLIHPTKPGGPRTLWHEVSELLCYEIVTGRPPGILTRLDRETSGVVLIGKGRAATARLAQLWQSGRVEKEYHALVFGWPERETWTVEAPILRLGEVTDSRVFLRRGVHPAGAPARTDFRLLRRLGAAADQRFAVVAAFPRTGRTHQIRVHLAHSGTPLVGDKLYARGEECYLEFIAQGWTFALQQRLLHPRHALHAHALRFTDGCQTWHITAPWPSDLAALEEHLQQPA